MVVQHDAELVEYFLEFFGLFQVGPAWIDASAGMVMTEDNPRGAGDYGGLGYSRDVNDARGRAAACYPLLLYGMAGHIEQQHPALLVVEAFETVGHQLGGIARSFDCLYRP